ncbi:MAG: hypothetical protein KTR25_10930 [Myxococcales bacterium]|nr:hypothetical protein [Myxococcales bacterium]
MANLRSILASYPLDETKSIVSASPRKFREELFKRFGIKSRAAGGGFKLSAKNDARARKFLELLQADIEVPDEVLQELARNYLYLKRSMLADALDHLDVPHQDGLTDRELDFIAKLPGEEIQDLRDSLQSKGHTERDVLLYLCFLGVTF